MTSPSADLDFRTWLAGLSAAELRTLLSARPDTVQPMPPSISALAARLLLPGSLHWAVRQLDALGLGVLQAIFAAGEAIEPLDAPKVVELVASSEAYQAAAPDARPSKAELKQAVTERIEQLIAAGLCFGTPQQFMAIAEAKLVLPRDLNLLYALEQPEVAIAGLPDIQRRILNTLALANGFGSTQNAASHADPNRPIPQLIAKGLLNRVNETTVVLPPSVRLVLNPQNTAAKMLAKVRLLPPKKRAEAPTEPLPIDAGQGLEVVRLVGLLLETLGESPQPMLKSGELGVRTLSALAKNLEVDEDTAARVITLAYAASLIAVGDPTPPAEDLADTLYLAPTTLTVLYNDSSLDMQWAWLLHAWWNWADMRFWEIDKSTKLFSPESIYEDLGQRRQELLLAALEHPVDVIEQFLFNHPAAVLNHPIPDFEALLAEARWLGVLGPNDEPTGVLTVMEKADPATVEGPLEHYIPEGLAAYLAQHTPAVVEQLIAQADMTILAPGPLPVELGKKMALIADRESTGVATTYRLTGASIRRGLDAGMSPKEMIALLGAHVLGELPDSMRYLIEDTAANHGQVRGGTALSYVTAQDPAAIAALCTMADAQALGLQQLAPTVAVAQVPLARLLHAAEGVGIHIVVQDSSGAMVSLRPVASMVPTPVRRSPIRPSVQNLVDRTVEMLQNQPSAATNSQDAPVDALRLAIRERKSVTLTFVDSNGSTTRTEVTPIALTAGQLSAVTVQSGALEHFLLHRITAVQ